MQNCHLITEHIKLVPLHTFVQQMGIFVVMHFVSIPDGYNIWMSLYSTFLLRVPKCNLLLPGGKLDLRVCLSALWKQDPRPLSSLLPGTSLASPTSLPQCEINCKRIVGFYFSLSMAQKFQSRYQLG